MAAFGKSYRYFVLKHDDEFVVLSWREFTAEWLREGYEPIDWFEAKPNCEQAILWETARERGKTRGYEL